MGPIPNYQSRVTVVPQERDWAFSSLEYASSSHAVSKLENGIRAIGNELIDTIPALRSPAVRLWYGYVYLHVRAVAAANAVKYAAPIDPFEIHWVDVDRIDRQLPPFPRPKYRSAGRVADGDWDRMGRPFEETDLYRAFEAHFERNRDWEETEFYDRVVDQIENYQSMWGCRTRAEFEERCTELEALKKRIENEGYMTQAELAASSDEEVAAKDHRSPVARFILDEMTVSVARDGELLLDDGRDRLAIAKIIGLEEVPVWIQLRHAEWQRLRDRVATGEITRADLPDRLRTHPDIRNCRVRQRR